MMKPKILCIGDSITRGYNVQTEESYPWLLSQAIGVPIENLGINGDTTLGMLTRIEPALKYFNPDIVLVLGGVNDLSLKSKSNRVFANLVNIYRIIKHYGATPVACEILNVQFDPEINSKSSLFLSSKKVHKKVIALNKKIEAFSDYDNLPFIPFSNNFTTEMYLEDGLHPNNLGYQVMSENAENCIRELLFK